MRTAQCGKSTEIAKGEMTLFGSQKTVGISFCFVLFFSITAILTRHLTFLISEIKWVLSYSPSAETARYQETTDMPIKSLLWQIVAVSSCLGMLQHLLDG